MLLSYACFRKCKLGDFLIEVAKFVGWPYMGKFFTGLDEFFMELDELCRGVPSLV